MLAYHPISDLRFKFDRLESQYHKDPVPAVNERKRLLGLLRSELVKHQTELLAALSDDYGHRSEYDSLLGDILSAVEQIDHNLTYFPRWMKPQRRRAGLLLWPSRVHVESRPVGIVGIMVPWNFPISLAVGPLSAALAAGNRVMLKMSELTPQTNKVLAKVLLPFNDHVALVEGDVAVARTFAELPFGHLLFTGSTQVGRLVAEACAKNLTPTTLELGGKSPVFVDKSADLDKAIDAIIFGKTLNAGQICIAPDYVMLPRTWTDRFCQRFVARCRELDEQGALLSHYSSIINAEHFSRLQSLIDDAKSKGAKVIEITASPKPAANSDEANLDNINVIRPASEVENTRPRIMLPKLIINPTPAMRVCQEEIFGPLLPIIEYHSTDAAIDYINHNPKPLALYIMSGEKHATRYLLNHITSGGVCVNDTLMHISAVSAPFGGVGASGWGRYHGKEGFLAFSHQRTQLHTPKWLPRAGWVLGYRNAFINVVKRWFI
uniref:aldehyde dehydrogenase family protein n=1 Tax=Thaumasiovibrio occultus TaxID=1891184 RepID=UPI000B34DB50|nr:aldehyde dehydrogenase family protein [Thaumasiovibrio occultus]